MNRAEGGLEVEHHSADSNQAASSISPGVVEFFPPKSTKTSPPMSMMEPNPPAPPSPADSPPVPDPSVDTIRSGIRPDIVGSVRSSSLVILGSLILTETRPLVFTRILSSASASSRNEVTPPITPVKLRPSAGHVTSNSPTSRVGVADPSQTVLSLSDKHALHSARVLGSKLVVCSVLTPPGLSRQRLGIDMSKPFLMHSVDHNLESGSVVRFGNPVKPAVTASSRRDSGAFLPLSLTSVMVRPNETVGDCTGDLVISRYAFFLSNSYTLLHLERDARSRSCSLFHFLIDWIRTDSEIANSIFLVTSSQSSSPERILLIRCEIEGKRPVNEDISRVFINSTSLDSTSPNNSHITGTYLMSSCRPSGIRFLLPRGSFGLPTTHASFRASEGVRPAVRLKFTAVTKFFFESGPSLMPNLGVIIELLGTTSETEGRPSSSLVASQIETSSGGFSSVDWTVKPRGRVLHLLRRRVVIDGLLLIIFTPFARPFRSRAPTSRQNIDQPMTTTPHLILCF